MQKKIPFQPELIGKPGITVKADGEVPDFIKWYPEYDFPIRYVLSTGKSDAAYQTNSKLTMYRAIRSAEEIAKEVYDQEAPSLMFTAWKYLGFEAKRVYTALVQSGIDEMKGGEE